MTEGVQCLVSGIKLYITNPEQVKSVRYISLILFLPLKIDYLLLQKFYLLICLLLFGNVEATFDGHHMST